MIYAVAIVHRRLHMSKPGRGLDDASPPSRCYSADGEDTPSHTGEGNKNRLYSGACSLRKSVIRREYTAFF